MPAVFKPVLPRVLQALRVAERCGERCGAPVLMAGLIVGIGVVELDCGPLGQTSRFSLELLILLVLQLVGPGVVALIAMTLRQRPVAWWELCCCCFFYRGAHRWGGGQPTRRSGG